MGPYFEKEVQNKWYKKAFLLKKKKTLELFPELHIRCLSIKNNTKKAIVHHNNSTEALLLDHISSLRTYCQDLGLVSACCCVFCGRFPSVFLFFMVGYMWAGGVSALILLGCSWGHTCHQFFQNQSSHKESALTLLICQIIPLVFRAFFLTCVFSVFASIVFPALSFPVPQVIVFPWEWHFSL